MVTVKEFFGSIFKKATLEPVGSLDKIEINNGIIFDSNNTLNAMVRTSKIELEPNKWAKLYGMTSFIQEYNPATLEPIGDRRMGLNLQFCITQELINQGKVYRVVYQ